MLAMISNIAHAFTVGLLEAEEKTSQTSTKYQFYALGSKPQSYLVMDGGLCVPNNHNHLSTGFEVRQI